MNITDEIKTQKKDKKLLFIIIIVAFVYAIWNGKGLLSKVPILSQVYSSDQYAEMKVSEEQLWNRIKGQDTLNPSESSAIDWESIDAIASKEPEKEIVEVKEPEKLELPLKILLVGDSLILEGFGPQFDKMIKTYDGIELHRYGKYSTGLNKIDYFDWYSYTDELIDSIQPDILIIMIGANDGQAIVNTEGKSISLKDTENWNNAYRERVIRYLQLTNHRVEYVYWVGHPIPRDSNFYDKFERMNLIYKEESAKYSNVIYIDSWSRFAVDGKYSATLKDSAGVERTVKASDGVHLTTHGGNILSELVIEYLSEQVNFESDIDNELMNN